MRMLRIIINDDDINKNNNRVCFDLGELLR